MKFLAACEDTGSVKEIVCVHGTDTSKQDKPQPISIRNVCNEEGTSAKSRVLHMEISGDYLIALRADDTLRVYDINTEEYDLLKTYQLSKTNKDDFPVSLVEDKTNEVILATYSSGRIFFVNLDDGKFELPPISIQLDTKKPISCISLHPVEPNVVVFGGQENDARIIRLYDEASIPAQVFTSEEAKETFFGSQKVLFAARNVKNDHLDLRPPIWITKVEFLDNKISGEYQFITTTKYGQLRMYDTKHGKRPKKDYPLCQKSIITLSFTNGDQEDIIISDTHGLVAKYSLEKVDQKAFKTHSASAGTIQKPVAKLLGKYTGGNTGAVFGVDVVDSLVATGGLDRYLRVYDVEDREVVAKVYLGTQINSVIVLDTEDETEENDDEGKRKHEESDEEELWDQLEHKKAKK